MINIKLNGCEGEFEVQGNSMDTITEMSFALRWFSKFLCENHSEGMPINAAIDLIASTSKRLNLLMEMECGQDE